MTARIPGARHSRDTLGERRRTHGHSMESGGGTPTYRSWLNMKARCNNPGATSYQKYGGRGIRVCDRWMDFTLFLEDMGERPSIAHSIDREDGSRGYEPGNCRWATRRDQSVNRSSTRPVMRSDGKVFRSTTEAAESVGGSTPSVRDVCIKKRPTYRGFGWSFVE